MELKRTETSNIPFSLHDSRIVKIEINNDELIFNLDNVYEYRNGSEEYYPAKMKFKDIDFEECNIIIFDRQIGKGKFAGIRCGIKAFSENYEGAEFEILTETCGGYSTTLEGQIWKDECEPVSGIITIWTMGDVVFEFEKQNY